MTELHGRNAFITGGANGIGLALARALLAEGCRVAIADIRRDALDAALAELHDDGAIAIELDVASREAFARAADDVETRLGPVSLLFNNAGVNLFQTIDDSTYDDWDWVLGVNLMGVINGIQTFVPRMKARGAGGHVINTGSIGSFLVGPSPGIYTTTKFAVRGLSEALCYSLAPHGIGVSLLCPGLVATQIHASDEVRPTALAHRGAAVDPGLQQRIVRAHEEAGMPPAEVAAQVLDAIRAGRFYVFTHPELRDELREVFEEILAAYPDGDAPPARVAFEQGRRARYATARARARSRG